MGAVIKHWVRTKLGLPLVEYTDHAKFRIGLSNGYLIGEILRKYSLISDDQMIALRHSFSGKIRMKNMRYVHRWLTEGGFQVDFAELTDIAEEKPGSVIKFLYKLYFFLEGTSVESKEVEAEEPFKSIVISDLPQPNVETKEDEECNFNNLKKRLLRRRRERKKKALGDTSGVKSEADVGAKLTCAVKKIKQCLVKQEQDVSPKEELEVIVIKAPEVETKPARKPFKPEPLHDPWKYFTKHPCPDQPINICEEEAPAPPPSPKPDLEELVTQRLTDCPKFPPKVCPVKGDTLKAINVYLAHEAAENAKNIKAMKIQKENPCTPQPVNEVDGKVDLEPVDEKVRMFEICEQKELERLKAKLQRESRMAKEMDEFNYKVDNPNGNGGRDEIFLTEEFLPPIYHSDMPAHQKRIEKLKCQRKFESEMAEERTRMRKFLSAKIMKTIPQRIYDDLLATSISKAMTICGREAELADFLVDTHRRKSIFYGHKSIEETALRRLLCDQEDRIYLQKMREEELKRELEQTALDYAERMALENLLADQRSEAELLQTNKFMMDLLNALVDLATEERPCESSEEDVCEEGEICGEDGEGDLSEYPYCGEEADAGEEEEDEEEEEGEQTLSAYRHSASVSEEEGEQSEDAYYASASEENTDTEKPQAVKAKSTSEGDEDVDDDKASSPIA